MSGGLLGAVGPAWCSGLPSRRLGERESGLGGIVGKGSAAVAGAGG